uniref:Glycosyltransferase n=2 Tax=Nymphaea colorata TaxID=210225 RepID=A0A5K1A949_9MAGN
MSRSCPSYYRGRREAPLHASSSSESRSLLFPSTYSSLIFENQQESASRSDLSSSMVHIVMFPYMGHGHFNPFVALAELILRHHPSCTITIVGTPLNVANLRSMLPPSPPVRLAALPFDPSAHGLPPHAESNSDLNYQLRIRLNFGSRALRPALESLLLDLISSDGDGSNPICLIADQFFGWTVDVARRLGIFHTLFYTCSAHGIVTYISLWRHLPHTKTDEDEFALPDFPHVRLHRTQLSRIAMSATGSDPWSVFYGEELTMNLAADGVLVNTVEEMEPEGVDRLRSMFQGKPVWCIGPVLPSSFLAVDSRSSKQERLGKVAMVSSEDCSKWLDIHPRGSVLYVSFGSQHNISASQMRQLAMGLEESGVTFIWVVRPPVEFSPEEEFRSSEWLTEGFEERMMETKRGLVVRNWAPQLTILSHESTGGFLSHCGWNSLLESFMCGVPIIGWPVAAEQFYNSEMVVEQIGAGVELARGNQEEVRKEEVARVAKLVMGDTVKRKEVRKKAGEVREMLRGAWRKQEHGSGLGPSLSSLNDFIETIFTGKE